MLVSIDRASIWTYNNGHYNAKVKVIKVVGSIITFKDDLEYFRQSCTVVEFLNNSKFVKARKPHKDQKKNLPKYFELDYLKEFYGYSH